jgi:hypothetical protein
MAAPGSELATFSWLHGFYPRNLGHFCPLARVVADFLSVLIFHDVAMQLNYYLLHYSAE